MKALALWPYNTYFDFLPTVAQYVVFSNDILRPQAGFTLYNITDGIVAHDIAAWFGRWLIRQHPSWNVTTVTVLF